MSSPIEAFEGIKQNFNRYIKTAFGTSFPSLEKEREELLLNPGVLAQDPWIEPLPRYKSSNKKVMDLTNKDLPNFTPEEINLFKKLVQCGLFNPENTLYTHQARMLTEALSSKHCVITSGTGSGKTESFLLPLFAYLSKEASKWGPISQKEPHADNWWKSSEWQNQCNPQVGKTHRIKRSYRIPQRKHETRQSGVRALILYPMNALVEDQLTRLRKALDSEDARKYYDEYLGGNKVYFGRYNGMTPVAGHEYKKTGNPNKDKIEELAKKLREIENTSISAFQYSKDTDNREIPFFFPRLDGSEMRSRWDMQDFPPDILITNYSMLSIMMMREVDDGIFEETKRWLKESKDNIFHLIIDELHMYRGTSGAEVSYLLKLLLKRLDLKPDHPQLRILASSASLEPDDVDSRKFLKDFFGIEGEKFEIISGTPENIPTSNNELFLPSKPFIQFNEEVEKGTDLAINNLLTSLGCKGQSIERLKELLESEDLNLTNILLNACRSGDKIRAVSISDFSKKVFGPIVSINDRKNAVSGLFKARALCDTNDTSSSLPSFRFHWFFRNIEGLWASTSRENIDNKTRSVGKLFSKPRIIDDKGKRVLDLLYCEQCGTVFYGGNRLVLQNGEIEMLITSPDIEGIPDRNKKNMVEQKKYDEYTIFWPVTEDEELHKETYSWNQPKRKKEWGKEKGEWKPASLSSLTGRVKMTHEDANENPSIIKGYNFIINHDETEDFKALPSICPCCSADYSKRKYLTSPIRGFRTGFSKVSQILSKELFHQLSAWGSFWLIGPHLLASLDK